MAIEVTADLSAIAYATADQADAVAELRVGGSRWTALTDDQKDAALATATRDIDSIEGTSPGFIGGFIGDRASDDQALEWPRTGTKYSSTAWPQLLVDATIELAITYAPLFAAGATGDPLNQDPNAFNLKREKIGPLETEYFTPQFVAPTATAATAIQRFPAMVQRLLVSLVVVASSTWRSGSAVVSRGS